MTIASTSSRMTAIRNRAESLFDQVWFMGRMKSVWWRLTGQSGNLAFLGDLSQTGVTPVRLERQPINLMKIIGTNGRTDRFDRNFRPITLRSRARWVGVASAMIDDILQIPPIEVIQVGEVYYVIDGHHRVSAARALDWAFIDATVIRWDYPE
jgi:hypothetical protein